MTPTRSLGADPVEQLLRCGVPGEPVEEIRLLAELEADMFGVAPQPVTLSRYVLLRPIATGGAGVVYAAFDPELDRKVAIKLVSAHPPSTGAPGAARDRLLREARVLARLAHPHVIPVFDVGIYDRGVFIVMELADGEDLAHWLAQRRRRWSEVLEVFLAAGRGLAAAHDAGVVHRDFKPANVWVGRDPPRNVRVLDFGLASAERTQVAHLVDDPRARGLVLGTPEYMSPEQHRGEQADAAADQFAFFAALWEGLCGALPFAGNTLDELARAKMGGPPPFPDRARVPRWLRRIVARGLSPRRRDRFESLAAALDRLERGRRAVRRRVPLAAATIVGIGALVASLGDRADDRCSAVDRELVGVWDGATSTEVRNALDATGEPFAAAAADQVQRALDHWSEAWTRSRAIACLADASEATRCLDRQRLRLAQLVELLRHADGSVAASAVDAVASLPPVGECATPLAELRSSELVDEDEVELLLARAETLLRAGRVRDAIEPATAANRLDASVPTHVRASLVLGAVLFEAGDGEGSERELGEALREAEAAGEDDLAVRALIELAAAIRRRGGRDAEAERLAIWAQARLEHRGRRDALDVRLAFELGAVRRNLGRFDEAAAMLEPARELACAVYGEDHPRVADIDNELGNILDQQGRYAEARDIYERALALRLASFGPEHPRVAAVHNNLGNVLSSLGEHERSAAEYAEALRVYMNVLGPDHRSTLQVRSNLAVLAMHSGRPAEGLAAAERLLAERRAQLPEDHPDIALSEDNVGFALHAVGREPEAIEHHRVALALRERNLGLEHPDIARSLANLASSLADAGQPEEALVHHRRALAIRERMLGSKHPMVAESLLNLGRTLVQLGRPAEAFAPLHRARAIEVQRVGEDTPDVATIDAALAMAIAAE